MSTVTGLRCSDGHDVNRALQTGAPSGDGRSLIFVRLKGGAP